MNKGVIELKSSINAEKDFKADIDSIYFPPVSDKDDSHVIIYLENIPPNNVSDYIERSELLSQTNFSSIAELMYSINNFDPDSGEEPPTLSIGVDVDTKDDPKLEIVYEDGKGYPYAEVPLTEKEKSEINAFIVDKLGCTGSEYINNHEISLLSEKITTLNEKIESREADHYYADSWEQAHQITEDINRLKEEKNRFEDMLLKAGNGSKLDKTSAAELLLTADMITIAELSPYFNEDKKAAIKLDETTAEFLINKSPELKQAFEDKGYDNWKEFFADNHGEAFLEANVDIGIKVVINDNKEYPIPLSPVEQAVLRDRLDEELTRRNKEYMHDKDGDRIPDNIDSSFDPETNRHYEQEDKKAADYDDNVKIRLVTDQELKCLKENETPVLVGKNRASNGLIPIKYKKEKESVVMAALAAIQHHEKKVVKR